ncbi:MAG: oligopeptide ABC transporter permease OppB [Methylococcales bacterium]
MIRYTLQRLLTAIPTLFLLVSLAFFMIRAAPGGPFDTEKNLAPEITKNLNRIYHLDEPLLNQYGRYLHSILQGDLGPSFQYQEYTVNELIGRGFPVSMQLGLSAIILAVVIGCALGIVAALKQHSATDHAVMTVAMGGISIPNFVIAPLLILFFGVYLEWLPAGGWEAGIRYKILPVIALALPQIAYIARLMRSSMIEVLHAPYIRTARAKGMPTRIIIFRHSLRPAFLPVLSYLGPATAGIITGSVVIEQIFGIPGIGRYFVQGALNRDYTLVMGVVIFYGALIILFNFIADLLYVVLDPKVAYD